MAQSTRSAITTVEMLLVAILLFAVTVNNGATRPLQSSFDMQVPNQPQPVVIKGKTRFVYELHLTNFSPSTLMLKCVSVIEVSSNSQVMNVCDDALAQRIGSPAADKRIINPAAHAVVYFEIDFPKQQEVASTFKHRVQYEEAGAPNDVEGAEISIHKNYPLLLDPPVSGGPWAAIYEPSWERGHRRVFYAVDGHARLPGRFAIDWIKLDEQGKYAKGDDDQVSNWYGYGADVIAVADAYVAASRDNIKESKIVSAHPRHKLEEAAGNYIALDLGNGSFAFYEHLKPGSVRVKVGDRVQKGQVIASLGFTGDSTGPHLHFHVADRNSLLGAEGVPYHFKSFNVIGSYNTLDEFGKKRWNSINDSSESQRSSEFPASNTVVHFNPSFD